MTKTDASEIISQIDRAITKVRTRALDVSFNELFDMYNSKELTIAPEFQRLFRWPEEKQSQFIESLILELPIPPIYVIEQSSGEYELIDGLQRISSYIHFRGFNPRTNEKHDLQLVDCDVLPALNGLTYDDLPTAIQIKLKRHFIRMEVLRRESDDRLRYHMFKRLNTGGEILSPQEIRNATIRLLSPRFNDFIKQRALFPDFITCMSPLTDEKRDRLYMEEYVLRFFAMKNNREEYEKDVGDFLTEYMELVSDPKLKTGFDYESEQQTFEQTFSVLARALGENAFSGVNKLGNPQGYFSSLLFEALTIGIQPFLSALATTEGETWKSFAKAVSELKADPEFQKKTKGGGKNYAAALSSRVAFVEARVKACLQR